MMCLECREWEFKLEDGAQHPDDRVSPPRVMRYDTLHPAYLQSAQEGGDA